MLYLKRTMGFLFVLTLFLIPELVSAQSKVSGSVISDTDKKPVAGVTVKIKGTARATQSGENGIFSIDAKEGETIVFTHVNFQTAEMILTAANKKNLVFELTSVSAALNEVVVVGYGTQKKVNLTGAVEVVKGAELVNRATATVSQALQGKVSGINFNTGSFGFEPGAAMNIQIRGQGTPLILVDGIQTPNLNGLNPNDIESMSILKDAAASAIYGAKAPYGVVLITTKSGGTAGKLNLDYSANYSYLKPIRMPHLADSYSTAMALNEASINSGLSPLYTNATVDRIMAYMKNPGLPETIPSSANASLWANTFESNANYDWFNVFYGNGNRSQQNLTVSGGNKGVSFYLSGGIENDGGILQVGTDNYKRYNTTAKVDATLTKWMKVTSNTRYFNTSRNTPAYDNQGNYDLLFHQVARTFPTQYLASPNGVLSIQSKIPWTRDAGNENTSINDVTQRFATEITPMEGWTINADYTLRLATNLFTSDNYAVYEDQVNGTPVLSGSTSNFVAESHDLTIFQAVNLYSTYKFNLGKKHNFQVMAGYQADKTNYSYVLTQKTGTITPAVPAISASTGIVTGNDNYARAATAGAFGRINYSYENKYLLELNGRYDGTYKFADGKRFGFFPSLSTGWNVSNEKFWDKIKNTVNAFKIRGSWGSLGNQLTANPYQDIPLIGVSANLPWLLNGTRPSYTTAPTLVNPDITWEVSNTKDLGVDISFFHNRLTVTGDIYQRLTTDQLGPAAAVPAVIGASLPQANNMETKTNGWELSLNWKDKIGKDFHYSVTAMMFDYQTTVMKYNNPTRILTNPYSGQVSGEIWGLVSNGLIQQQADADRINTGAVQKAVSGQVWKTGDMMYRDLNGDGLITYGANTVDNPGDKQVIGNVTPRYQFGLTLRAEWKGFDFSMFWQGVGQRDLALSGNMFWGFSTSVQGSIFPGHLNYYRDVDATTYAGLGKNTTDAYFPRPYLDANNNGKNQLTQTMYLLNGAYARLKNMQVGYTLSESIAKKIHFQSIYIYGSGENLATITSMPSHFDPETANVGVRGNAKSYFSQAAFTFSINLKF